MAHRIDRISRLLPPQVYDRGERPSRILDAPVRRDGNVLDLQEKMHQAEVDANLRCAFMKHEAECLQIILKGMNHK